MIRITAPDNRTLLTKQTRIFIAGGISLCPDWQNKFIDKFKDFPDDIVMINPRRYDFDITNPNMSSEQIEWEYSMIEKSNIMVFWFPKETLCPITLFELGNVVDTTPTIFIGCHPDYARRFDVIKQVGLRRDDVEVVDSLDALEKQLKDYLNTY